MAGKRRYVGPGGAVFVPNVSEETIAQHVKDGIWKPVPEPEPEPAKRDNRQAAAPSPRQPR